MSSNAPTAFYIQQDGVVAVPVLHYTMEMAAEVKRVFDLVQPSCVAVEMHETLQLSLLHAASRLPDISVVQTEGATPLYYLAEPCDPAFEGLRSALELGVPAFCIDLDVEGYPEYSEPFPDPYAITHIGYAAYYQTCKELIALRRMQRSKLDHARELHMARRLKELSLRYDKVLFVGGMHHVEAVLEAMQRNAFPAEPAPQPKESRIYTLTDASYREVMAEMGWMTLRYEEWRGKAPQERALPDRQPWLYQLFDFSSRQYAKENTVFPRYHMHNLMKFARNYALVGGRLMPDLYRVIMTARGCVDGNYGYEVWKCATDYPPLRNIDGLEALTLSPEDLWGASRKLKFQLRQPRRKGYNYADRKRKERAYTFSPHGAFSLCSYPPEDLAIEKCGQHLKKRAMQILLDEQTRTIPFSDSLEDGIDMRETVRHWQDKKLYVRKQRRPKGEVGSVVIIFDSDLPSSKNGGQDDLKDQDPPQEAYHERYPWKMTWIGEHEQESDMAFYATSMGARVVGPGISRCEYGGFMLSYPPRRLHDVWQDEDYASCDSKAECLLMSAIDYCVHSMIVYVAPLPPPSRMKRFAARFGKKVLYIPLSQLSPPLVQKLRVFHVLDGKQRRDIAGEYIL